MPYLKFSTPLNCDQVWHQQFKHEPFEQNYPNRKNDVVVDGSDDEVKQWPGCSYAGVGNIKLQDWFFNFDQECFMTKIPITRVINYFIQCRSSIVLL